MAYIRQKVIRLVRFCFYLPSEIQTRLFDRLLGVSTRGIVVTDDRIFNDGSDMCFYQDCQWLPVLRALRALKPTSSDVFVDLGSGKGRALLVAGFLPYLKAIGIERDEDLARDARQNIAAVRPRLRARQVESVTTDVLDWSVPPDVSVIFIYNSFIGQTFHAVLTRIFESYDRSPRDLHIVYDHPWEHDWLLSTGRVTVERVAANWWPAHPGWWRRAEVIVTYRVTDAPAGEPQRPAPAAVVGHRAAVRHWIGPNGHRFSIWAPDHGTVYSR